MPPATITRLLRRLRRRERLQALAWAVARAVAVAFAFLVAACLIDWVIDRRRDTPHALRVSLLVVQAVVWLAAASWALRKVLRRLGDDELALRVEERLPELGHRLISAVQLNRAGARTEGMSPALIAAVTAEAEARAASIRPAEILGDDRLRRAALVLAPVAQVALLLAAFAPATCAALLARVFLEDQPIPRSVELRPRDHLWAAGEEGTLELTVRGSVSASEVGEVLIEPESGPPVRLALEFGEEAEGGSVFVAKVPAGDVPFTYRAWLGDGRLKTPGAVRYSPRPVVGSLVAWVDLPTDRIGRQPGGEPYAELQRGGDVLYRLDGSRARLELTSQVPVVEVRIRVEGKAARDEALSLPRAAEKFTASFGLRPGDTGYAVTLHGANGFASKEPARRSIRRLPLEPPAVALLPETFWREGDDGPPEDREVEGIPVLLGERCRLDYQGSDRYGLSHARLRYLVVPRGREGDDAGAALDLDRFVPLPLGSRRNPGRPADASAREEFSTRPAAHAGALPDGEGGGRYDFSSAGIPDGKGGLLKLAEGDRILFYVEMFSKADPEGKPGRSAVREKEVLALPGYLGWLKRKDDLAERTRLLEQQQRTARPEGGNDASP